ncbi:MAG: pantoate--beta-alanine ligase [Chitinophagales bacterium]
MKVFSNIKDLQQHLQDLQVHFIKKIGFVPTMGALHDGHLSLISAAKEKSDITVCSIFVNPTQFNDKQDFEKYPINIDADLEMLLDAKCDVVFIPTVEEIYPNGLNVFPEVDLGFLATTLEAAKRPGHYEGVVQVVKRLLEIVQPQLLFLGQKDYQQCMVIQKLIDTFEMPISIQVVATVREDDGLAMSSRNVRLDDTERQLATKLSQTIFDIRDNITTIDFKSYLNNQIEALQQNELIQVDYLMIVNGKTLEPISTYQPDIPITVLIAAFVGKIRLIDNVIVQ